jgi:FkbM family methyltransferase
MYSNVAASKAALLLASNPALFFKMAVAKASTHRQVPELPARKQVNGVWFELDLAEYWGTAAMYYGSYSLVLVDTMKRILRPGDVFLDIGANIGYMSAIGAGLVGKEGQVHSFEPIPKYFQRLKKMTEMNPEYSIFANQCAAGSENKMATASVTTEVGQNTLVDHYVREETVRDHVDVRVVRLDEYLKTKAIDSVKLIKIDTEGFEFPVLLGLQRFFENARSLPAIICEVGPRAYPLLGYKTGDLARYMSRFGYEPRNIIAPSRSVDLSELWHVDDVLFLPRQ